MNRTVARLLTCLVALALPLSALAQSNVHGIDPRNIDETIKPCMSFDQYANGNWMMNNPIPKEYTSWGTWEEVRERNLNLLKSILEETAAKEQPQGSVAAKVALYYRLAMDSARAEAAGAQPLKADLDRIAALKSPQDVSAYIAQSHSHSLDMAFGIGVEQDLAKSDQYIVYASQGGLGLPDRDYYLKDDDDSRKIRDEYVEHVTRMLKLAGFDSASAASQAQSILAFETRLAKASLTRVEMRNPEVYYNIKTVAEADAATPHLGWPAYFETLGLKSLGSFSLGQPGFFTELNTMIQEAPLPDWQAYLRWHIISQSARCLSSAFVNEDFRFNRQVLRGAKEIQPRWKRVQGSMDWQVGQAVGQLYVAKAFPPEAKARALKMIEDLRAALKIRLEQLDWMGADTKAKALAKLATFTPKIGYPDVWRDYSSWTVGDQSYLANSRLADEFEFKRNLGKLGQPVDRTEWGMAPQIVNAYYNPTLNEVVFPAGILQPPFFDFKIDDAVNYGAMGAVIGHELLHGFDDQGRKFDAQGNMANWWTQDDEDKFKARSQRLVDQFNHFVIEGDVHVNGELTLGENIADLGGLTMAYYALQLALGDTGRERIDGFTPEQRFFLAWAQVWRRNVRPEALKLQVNTDPHAPAHYRIDGPLANMPEFHKAFGCEGDATMVSPATTRVTIW
jgi:putative endopeptidase